jgi:hypothetical protein
VKDFAIGQRVGCIDSGRTAGMRCVGMASRSYLLKKAALAGCMPSRSAITYSQLEAEQLQEKLLPLRLDEYETVSDSQFEPSLDFALIFRDCCLYFLIYSVSGRFRIQICRKPLKAVPDLEKF